MSGTTEQGQIKSRPTRSVGVGQNLSLALAVTIFGASITIIAALMLDNRILFLGFAVCLAMLCVASWLLFRTREQARSLHRRLASQDSMLNGILTSSPLAIVDQNGLILRISHAACAMFGIDKDSPIGHPITDHIPGFSMDLMKTRTDPIQMQTARPPTWTGRRNGSDTFPLAIEAGALPGKDNHFILSFADLEAWYAADTRAAELQAQLAVVGRLDSMGRMAAIIAHELNQPLAAAGIYLHAARKDIALCGPAGQSAERTIDLAKHQVLRAGEIIRKMRDLLSHGTLTLEPDRVSSIIADLLPITDLKGRDGNATIRYDIDMTSDRVLAERIQIQQAVINLINNAVDAVRDRSRRHVIVKGRATSDTLFEITVEDSGPGIDPDRMDSLFRPLNSTKKDGMGLGLSIVRTIVESHGGSLSVRDSELGGAAFCFTLTRT